MPRADAVVYLSAGKRFSVTCTEVFIVPKTPPSLVLAEQKRRTNYVHLARTRRRDRGRSSNKPA